ncbi:MAG: IS200/IS605 family transposase [Gemmataceae bacterium]|nr:IS200/IS605 family transposase [Gemmataceae bacterium]
MARNFYSEINLHIVWHTKENSPLLVPKVEAIVRHELHGKCINTRGIYLHETGGIEDHVHLAISVAPTIGIADFIGQLKGASAHEANQKLSGKLVEWQAGYGVVSFGTRDLEWVRRYIQNQRERHARGEIEERLERITSEEAEAEPREGP